MDKKIGSVFLIILFSGFIACKDISVQMYVFDLDNNPIRQVEAGVPFLLQVVVDNASDVKPLQDLTGSKDFDIKFLGSSRSTNIINGDRTDRVMFNYQLSCIQKGSYKLGPIEMQTKDGKTITSGTVTIVVGDSSILYNVKKKLYSLEVTFDQKTVYIRQKIIAKIRFYHIDPIDGIRLLAPKIQNFVVGYFSEQSTSGEEVLSDTKYYYKEWVMHVYPEKEGTLVFPSLQALFTLSSSQGFLNLFDVFGMGSEKTVQSAPRSVEVKPLPLDAVYKDVSAIGLFTKASFVLQKNRGEIGEGIVCEMVVQGDGNLDVVKSPKLHLPKGLKYYESNSAVKKVSEGIYEKRFEYIIQGEQNGEYEISPQSFVYYNPKQSKYAVLKTGSSKIRIYSDDSYKLQQTINDDDYKKIKSFLFKPEQIQKVYHKKGKYITTSSRLQNYIYIGVVICWIISFLLGLYLLLVAFIVRWVTHNRIIQVYINSRKVDVLYRKGDLYGMYQLLRSVCQKYGYDMRGQDIIDVMKQKGLSDHDIDDWKSLVNELLSITFAKDIVIKNQINLLNTTRNWIKRLFGILV